MAFLLVTRLTEQESAWATIILLTLMAAAWLLTVIPSCNEPDCVKSHQRHRVAERSAEIERTHAAFHDPRTRPVPMCASCQAARRDQDDGS